MMMMIASAVIVANATEYNHGNGQPGCQLTEEFGRKWRNNWDPIRFWLCQGHMAVSFVCPPEHLFADSMQGCVHYTQWVWTKPFNPPSLA